ncbi:MAG: NADH-ubiquinone oxidoreductase-F iron-sulfur binding region domain-containing protein [Patescibacteria group bacterium]
MFDYWVLIIDYFITMDILNKIKKAGLVGRGGACFPTATKWQMVKNAEGEIKYVVCNASEGEPGIKKDFFILENYGERVIDGIDIAIDFLKAEKAYIFLNFKYYKKLNKKIDELIKDKKINIFTKPINSGYIGGEESSVLNTIEGKRIEPRFRPPFPTTAGLHGCPTLINNVETFYNVSLVATKGFKKNRFYTIDGDCLNAGVYEMPDSWTINKILKETNNYPRFPFFVQIGGDASGWILNNKQLGQKVTGSGSVTIYSMVKNKPKDLIKNWLNFFLDESCGQCTPCREGVYRLVEIIESSKPNWQLFSDLLENLELSAFCGLGCAVPIPIESYVNNVLVKMPNNKIKIKNLNKKVICECFK